jgi:hypothetical protein
VPLTAGEAEVSQAARPGVMSRWRAAVRTFPKLFSGPFGAPRMRENVRGSPADVGTFMAPGEAVKLFDVGSCCGGLRIVATSTRVRLFFPRWLLRATCSLSPL